MKKIYFPVFLLLIFLGSSTALKAQLKSDFTIASDTICSSVAENFVGKPSGGTSPYRVLWSFGDGDTSTATNPSHTYNISGTYNVTLYVLDASFDTTSTTKPLTVLASPKPDLGPDKRGCWGQGVMLTTGLHHEPVADWTWILGKDTNSITHGDTILVEDSGTYTVKVQDTLGCAGADTVKVSFNPLVSANRIDTTVCIGDSVSLKAGIAGAGATYKWIDLIHNTTVGTGSVFKFFTGGGGSYSIAADFQIVISQTSNGLTCTDTGYINVTVNTPSHPTLSNYPPICITDPAFKLYTDTPYVDLQHQGGTWYYNKNTFAIVNNYLYPSVMGETDNNNSLGFIHYVVANKYGCSTDDSTKITISALPKVSAGPDTEICLGNGRYMLNNTNVSPPGGVWIALKGTPSDAIVYSMNRDSVFFDPNAGGISNGKTYGIIYNYQTPTGGHCSNSDTVFIKVTSLPNAYWTMNYFGDSVYFHAIDSNLVAPSYHWDFGDGNTSAGNNPKHLYANNKSYTVSLAISEPFGCTNTYDSTLNVTLSGIEAKTDGNISIDVYPNPFNASTTLQYELNKPDKVTIGLYDITGKQIGIIEDKNQAAGQYSVNIRAEKYHLGSGVYLLKIMTGDGYISRHIVKL